MRLPLSLLGDTLGVGELVQEEHGTHLVEPAVALAGGAAVVTDHEVGEVAAEGGGLRQPEAQAQFQQAGRPQVGQSKRLRHDVFQPPVGLLFLVGFRQIQIVLPDVLEGRRRREKESFQSSEGFCLLIDSVINHQEGFRSSFRPEARFCSHHHSH